VEVTPYLNLEGLARGGEMNLGQAIQGERLACHGSEGALSISKDSRERMII
jgi:hypothetical protein